MLEQPSRVVAPAADTVDLDKLLAALKEFDLRGRAGKLQLEGEQTLKDLILQHPTEYPACQYLYQITPGLLREGIAQLEGHSETTDFRVPLNQFLIGYEADLRKYSAKQEEERRKYAAHLAKLENSLESIAENVEKIKELRAAAPNVWLEQIMAANFEGPDAAHVYLFDIDPQQIRDDLIVLKAQNRIPEEIPADWLIELIGTEENVKLYRAFLELYQNRKTIMPACAEYGNDLIQFLSQNKATYKNASYLLSLNVEKIKAALAELRSAAGAVVKLSDKAWDQIVTFYADQQTRHISYKEHLANLKGALTNIAAAERESSKSLDKILKDAVEDSARYPTIAYLVNLSDEQLNHLISDIAKLKKRKENINPEELKKILVALKSEPKLSVTPGDFVQALVALQSTLNLKERGMSMADIIFREFQNHPTMAVSKAFRTMDPAQIALYMQRFEKDPMRYTYSHIKITAEELAPAVEAAQFRLKRSVLDAQAREDKVVRDFATELHKLSSALTQKPEETLASAILTNPALAYFKKMTPLHAEELMKRYEGNENVKKELPIPENIKLPELKNALEEVQMQLLSQGNREAFQQTPGTATGLATTSTSINPFGDTPRRSPSFWQSKNAGQKAGLIGVGVSGLTGIAAGVTALTSLNTMTLGTVVNTLGFKFVLGATLAGMTVPVALLVAAGVLAALAALTYLLATVIPRCGRNAESNRASDFTVN